MENFVSNCLKGEALDSIALVKLFDADREKGFLEKIFVGKKLRQLYQDDDQFKTAFRESVRSPRGEIRTGLAHDAAEGLQTL